MIGKLEETKLLLEIYKLCIRNLSSTPNVFKGWKCESRARKKADGMVCYWDPYNEVRVVDQTRIHALYKFIVLNPDLRKRFYSTFRNENHGKYNMMETILFP